jgi:hypothetical protein
MMAPHTHFSESLFRQFIVVPCHATGLWFSLGALVSSTNKTEPQDITKILLKVALKHHNPNPEMSV